jgi:clusterin-associated protein 1
VSRNLDLVDVEKQIRGSIEGVNESIASMGRLIGELEQDEKSLETKIDKKKADLARNEKRLAQMQNVRCVD